MKVDFFGSLLVILIAILSVKAFMLFGKIHEDTKYQFEISANSVLVDAAHADVSANAKEKDQKNSTSNIEKVAHSDTNNDSSSTVSTNLPQFETNLNSEEIKLLKELSRRREVLNKAQEDLKIRESLLDATESKLDRKMHDLQSLNAQVTEAMKIYNAKENGKIKSLVRIYENMKPKDAAKIFDALEMPILLDIISNMKETKVSPILAAMQTKKASELSVELTKRREIVHELDYE